MMVRELARRAGVAASRISARRCAAQPAAEIINARAGTFFLRRATPVWLGHRDLLFFDGNNLASGFWLAKCRQA